MDVKRLAAVLFSSILLSVLVLPSADAGLFGPNCKKVHPQGISLKKQIEKNYEQMVTQKNSGNIEKAYSIYKILNKKRNQLSELMGKDKNYRCFLDAEYSKSTYAWTQEYPGNRFGGPVKSLCLLWGYGCKPIQKTFVNPCDEYTLTRDYVDCIEDHARPTG